VTELTAASKRVADSTTALFSSVTTEGSSMLRILRGDFAALADAESSKLQNMRNQPLASDGISNAAAQIQTDAQARAEGRAAEIGAAQAHQAALNSIESQGAQERHEVEKKWSDLTKAEKLDALRSTAQGTSTIFSNLQKISEGHGKKMQAIGKIAAKGKIVSDTAAAVMGCWASLSDIPVVGPGLAIAAATTAAIAGATQLGNVDTPGLLSNVANKFLLDGFMAVDQSWRKLAYIRSVSDFKTITSYRLTGISQYDKVGPTGEIKQGTLNEEGFTNKADTYGKLFAISRANIINDDLGALSNVPKMLGRGGALKINDVFWTEYLDNLPFYSAGNGNYLIGASTPLTIDSLSTAVGLFMNQVDSNGKPLSLEAALLVVPPALKVQAELLFKSKEMRNTAAKDLTMNPHMGKYEPVASAYLSNPAYLGSSTVAWYLQADPRVLPLIEVALLNGKESPTIETAEADFSTLGIQMRGFHDFGVKKQDYRAGLKVKGSA
jgi:hypothetical protein